MEFREWLSMDEMRFKGLKRQFDQEHSAIPKPARDDLYHSRVAHLMSRQLYPQNTMPGTNSPNVQHAPNRASMMGPSQIMDRAGFRKDTWNQTPEILKNRSGREGVSPADFDERTQWHFVDRRFGFREETQIRNDKQRTDFQRQLATYKPEGKNEPVIVRHTTGGYQLLEGWHRTMSLLLKGCPQDQLQLLQSGEGYVQDFDLSRWQPVKIQAYIANGRNSQGQDADGTGDYVPGRTQDMDGTGEYIPQGSFEPAQQVRNRSIHEPVGVPAA